MTGKEVYQIWAPTGKKWGDWVRPVPFAGMKEYSKMYNFSNLTIPVIDFIDDKFTDAAIIVDLPGVQSVQEGVALAYAGYRPIPIFNGTIEQQGARATVDNQSVGVALIWGAAKLAGIELEDDALPAFLLDSNRMNRFKMEISLFDNSWDVYPQDVPSAEYLIKNGINKIIIIGESVYKDLKKILYEYQKKHIQIFRTQGYETPKKITIHRSFRREKY